MRIIDRNIAATVTTQLSCNYCLVSKHLAQIFLDCKWGADAHCTHMNASLQTLSDMGEVPICSTRAPELLQSAETSDVLMLNTLDTTPRSALALPLQKAKPRGEQSRVPMDAPRESHEKLYCLYKGKMVANWQWYSLTSKK